MKSESSLLDKRLAGKPPTISHEGTSWMDVMPHNYDDIEIDEDCPEYDSRYFAEPVHRLKGRIIPPLK